MKRRFLSFSLLAGVMVFSLSAVGLASCDSSGGNNNIPSVRLDSSELSLAVGEVKQLKISVSPKSATELERDWISNDQSVAIVKNGYVFGVGAGKCKVTCYLIGGGKAECNVTVTGSGQSTDDPILIFNSTAKELKVNDSFQITYAVYPLDTTIQFSSSAESIASVTDTGVVTAHAKGTAMITGVGSNGKTATCVITVTDGGGGGGGSGKHYSGTYRVGSPLKQIEFTKSLLAQFNRDTDSTINFEVITWEEDKAADQMTNPKDGPDVYPYASDQTLRLYSRTALGALTTSDSSWIRNEMGTAALSYATLSGVNKVVGYPFAADNGYVMFYDKSLVSESDIDTVDKLFAKADSLGYEVDFGLTGGFYSAGTLMTYAEGKSLYKLTAKESGYSSSSTFGSAAGLKAAKLMKKIFNEDALMDAAEAPGASRQVLATITDSSKVAAFKLAMGDNYAAAPLPWVDEARDTRLSVYLGYKFYGINPQKAAGAERLTIASEIAKYLASEDAQRQRYQQFFVKPTLSSIQTIAANEPHIAALNKQAQANGTVPLTAVDTALWSECAETAKSIKNLPTSATDADFQALLDSLDTKLYHK